MESGYIQSMYSFYIEFKVQLKIVEFNWTKRSLRKLSVCLPFLGILHADTKETNHLDVRPLLHGSDYFCTSSQRTC